MPALVVLAFKDKSGAAQMRDKLAGLQKRQLISMAAAVVVRRQDGKVKLQQAVSLAGAGALGGALGDFGVDDKFMQGDKMSEININAKVECVDGPCGQCLTLIVDRKTHKVTHLVIEDETLPYKPYQRLVPMDQVAETSPDLIRLGCSRDEVANMEPFIHIHYIQKTELSYSVLQGGEGMSDASAVGASYSTYEEKMVPEGAVAIRPGIEVQASDGHAGTVGDLVVDPQTAEVTHFVLREGHLWGKKEVTLPLAAVDRVAGDTVYLKLDRQAIGRLPAIPLRRHHVRQAGEAPTSWSSS